MASQLSLALKLTAGLSLAALCAAHFAVAARAGPAAYCTVDGKIYSPGAIVAYEDTQYRCMPLHVGAIKSAPTLAWQEYQPR